MSMQDIIYVYLHIYIDIYLETKILVDKNLHKRG